MQKSGGAGRARGSRYGGRAGRLAPAGISGCGICRRRHRVLFWYTLCNRGRVRELGKGSRKQLCECGRQRRPASDYISRRPPVGRAQGDHEAPAVRRERQSPAVDARLKRQVGRHLHVHANEWPRFGRTRGANRGPAHRRRRRRRESKAGGREPARRARSRARGARLRPESAAPRRCRAGAAWRPCAGSVRSAGGGGAAYPWEARSNRAPG